MNKLLENAILFIVGFILIGLLSMVGTRAVNGEDVEPDYDVITFTKDIKPVFMNKCASCHANDKLSLPNITEYLTAYELKDEIKRRVSQTRTMPKHGPFLTESERDLTKEWVDQGAKE